MGNLDRNFCSGDVAGGNGETDSTEIAFEKAIACTSKALLVAVEGEEVFIPKSEIHQFDSAARTLDVSTWLCRKRGWV